MAEEGESFGGVVTAMLISGFVFTGPKELAPVFYA